MIRAVYYQGREVAEFSLDRVCLAVEGRIDTYMILEIELVAQGTERDLQELVARFQQRWNLAMETRSKFEKALAFWDSPNP
jgi:inorganic triphosphatase YgiF